MRRLLPTPIEEVPDEALPALFAFAGASRWVRGSMVASLDGAVRGRDGSSRSIASDADRRVFSLLRRDCDVILVGAGTVREERYRPSIHPIAVVTRTLDLPADVPLFTQRDERTPRTLALTTARAAEQSSADLGDALDIIVCGDVDVDLHVAIDALVDRGLCRIHCEGGPRLLTSLATADLLDELLLTVSPLLVGTPDDDHIVAAERRFERPIHLTTTQVLEEDGTVFLRSGRQP